MKLTRRDLIQDSLKDLKMAINYLIRIEFDCKRAITPAIPERPAFSWHSPIYEVSG